MNLSCSNQDPCPVILDSKCVIYEGENLLYIGVNTNDNYRFALEQINSAIANLVLSGGITELIGDVVAIGPGIAAATLATVNSTPGQFGSSTAIPKITVDGKGRITAITTDPVFIPSGALSFIGDVTGTGNTGSNTTLTLATVNSNTYLSNSFLKFAVNGKGLVTSATPVVSGDIITALGYTPYNATNPSNYISRLGLSAIAPLGYNNSNGQFSIQQADSTHDGYLSSSDWSAFNSKQSSGNYITDLTGEASASGPGAANVTLSNSAVISKVLTGLNITGGSVAATDSILAAFGKVQNQINGLVGGSVYQGTWDALTNTPTLTSSVGTKGYYYIVSVAGTTNLNGITDWNLGDWAIFDGTAWQQVDNTDAVVSVNGYTGAVSLTTDDVPQGLLNEYFTTSKARLALSGGTGISYDNVTGIISSTITQYTDALARQAISLTTSGSSGAATYDNITGVLNIPNYTSALTGYVPYTGATTNLAMGTHGVSADYFQLATSPTTTGAVGQMWWNATDGTMNIGMGGGNATQQVGQETYYPYVVNKSGADLTEGTLVMANPAGIAQGNRISVVKAVSDGTYPAEMMLGVLTEDIGNNQQGFCTWFGYVRNLSLSAMEPAGETWAEGDILYGNPTIPGKLTKVMPSAPAVKSTIAVITAINGANLTIMVRPHFSSTLEQIDNVGISGIANNQGLFWDTNKWVNKTIASALGYTPISGTGTTNYLPKFTGSTALGNSSITDDGSLISLNNLTKIVYSDNAYQGLILKNTNTGTSALAGLTIQDSSSNPVAQVNYVPSNYANATLQNTFLFNTVFAQKLAFATNSGGGGTRADIYFTVNPAYSLSGSNPNQIHILGTSRNIVINYSGTDAGQNFQVNGTTNITGQLTLGSTITNGTYTYTLPSATGTLALTSALGSYVPTSRTLTINGTSYDLSADRSWTIASGVTSFNTRTGAVTLTSTDVTTALGYSPYSAANPSGYTSNTGTVTSVSGTGTVSGLTLSGTVTTSGSLTLGGTLSLTSGQVTTALGYTPQNSSTAITTSNIGSQSVSYATSAGSVSGGLTTSNYSSYAVPYNANFTRYGTLYNIGTMSIGQNTNGTAVIDAYGSYAYYGCNTASNGIRIDASGNVNIGSSLSVGGQITMGSLASADGMIENNTGGYFHLGGWGVGRTASTAILVNTAYVADYAGSVAWGNISGIPGNNALWDSWYGSSYLGSNGDFYLGWSGAWLSTVLSNKVPVGQDGIYTIGAGTGDGGFILYGSNYGAGYAAKIYASNGDGNTYFQQRNGQSYFSNVFYMAYTGMYCVYYGSWSDIRLKNVIETNPTIDVSDIDVIKYTLKEEGRSHIIRYGYSAQQVKSIVPDMWVGDNPDQLSLNYADVHTLKIASLERKIKELENKLNSLNK